MRDIFIARLTELAKEDDRIFLITGDLGFGVLNVFSEQFPEQFLNVGVAEQNMTGVAVGLALCGRVVFTYSIGNFPTLRCLEQIRNDAAYHDANVNVVAIGGGFSYGALGMSHHATEDIAILRAIPTLTVTSPCDDWETEAVVEHLARSSGTSYLRLDKSSAGNTQREGELFRFGAIRRLREGTTATLIATGGILEEALTAADVLAAEGTHVRVLSVHSLDPFDEAEVLAAARETRGLITIEEHTVSGGLGGLVAETCLEGGVPPGFFRRVGLRDGFASEVGSQQYLRRVYGLDAEAIVRTVQAAARGDRA